MESVSSLESRLRCFDQRWKGVYRYRIRPYLKRRISARGAYSLSRLTHFAVSGRRALDLAKRHRVGVEARVVPVMCPVLRWNCSQQVLGCQACGLSGRYEGTSVRTADDHRCWLHPDNQNVRSSLYQLIPLDMLPGVTICPIWMVIGTCMLVKMAE